MELPVVRTKALTKSYGMTRGVEDVTFEVRRGEVFGFLGPNGAGKTTTIRCMLDLLRPTSGSVEVLGIDPRVGAKEIAARVGYLPGEMGLADRMSARDHLTYLANLRDGRGLDRIDALAERFDLDLARPIRQMSRGNKQKVGIVQAFMHAPELLILDEPTGGLDPLMQQEFNKLVREVKAEGATVFLSSHILPEVETLCDRVAVIREGTLVAIDDVATFTAKALRHARIRFARPVPADALVGVQGVSNVRQENGALLCDVRGDTGALVKALAALDVVDLMLREPTLEEAFMGFYGHEEAPT